MKVIFVDIDGVLNYSGGKSVTPERMHFVEDEKLILLKQIVDATGAYLVLSSSWRYGWREVDFGRTTSVFAHNYFRLRDKFHEFGMAFFSKTPILAGFTREMEIRYWLSNYEDEQMDAYVILDDDEFEFQNLKDHLIQTQSNEGLLESHVIRAINILNI